MRTTSRDRLGVPFGSHQRDERTHRMTDDDRRPAELRQ